MHPTPTPADTSPAASAPVEPTIADTLRGAALYLGRHGWTRHDYFAEEPTGETPFPAACVHGAISAAAYGWANTNPFDPTNDHWAEARAFRKAITYFDDYIIGLYGQTYPDVIENAAIWNDMDGRTADEVILCLNAAATEWELAHDPIYRRHAGHDGTQPDCPYCPPVDDTDPDDESTCEGHESLAGEHMGETVFCDGTCQGGAR